MLPCISKQCQVGSGQPCQLFKSAASTAFGRIPNAITTHLWTVIGNSLFQHLILALVGGAPHPAGSPNALVGHSASPSNLVTGVHHHDHLVENVSQLPCNVAEQGCLAYIETSDVAK